jgi:hypothetical protein
MANPTELSPNVENLQVGKGIISFMKQGATEYRDLGNVNSMIITPEVETLEHFSSRTGIKTRDRLVTLQQKASVKIVMEEMTAQNIALMVYGTVDLAAVDGPMIEIFGATDVRGKLKFEGANALGPQMEVILDNVSWTPSGDLQMISDEWNSMEVTGAILPSEEAGPRFGKFGTIQIKNSTPS